jgi:hypothetical protein
MSYVGLNFEVKICLVDFVSIRPEIDIIVGIPN